MNLFMMGIKGGDGLLQGFLAEGLQRTSAGLGSVCLCLCDFVLVLRYFFN